MANESRKLKRGPARGDGRAKKKALAQPLVQTPPEMPNPFGKEQLKSLGLRLGLPLLGLWLIGAVIAGMGFGTTATLLALGVPGFVTLFLAGLIVWAVLYARKARGVHGILREAGSAEGRKAALEKLDAGYKKNDVTAAMAKAQLLLQEDPKKALAVMEEIDLSKVMNTVADEVRAQRAMIHLMLGEVTPARPLVDGIDVSRHQDAKTRAMLGSVVGECWARSGQAKKALETLELFDPEDSELAPVRAQLYRALAYAHAHTNDVKALRRDLKKLVDVDLRLLGSFLMKKTHPLLQKEAKKVVERSGQVRPKMVMQRR